MTGNETEGAVEAGGVRLAYREQGAGPAVVLVHGMADDARGWTRVSAALGGRARVIAYDRRGYGDSGAPDPYTGTTVQEQAQDAAALVEALAAGPALLCGRDFGALVCLDVAKRHRRLVSALAVVDPPVYALAPAATEALSRQRLELEDALRERGPEAAVEAFLAGADGDRARRASRCARAFFADYGGLASWPVTRQELRQLDMAVAILTSARAPAHALQAADALAALVPGARRAHGEPTATAIGSLLDSLE